jgi:hypothetical protein
MGASRSPAPSAAAHSDGDASTPGLVRGSPAGPAPPASQIAGSRDPRPRENSVRRFCASCRLLQDCRGGPLTGQERTVGFDLLCVTAIDLIPIKVAFELLNT